MKSAKFRMWSSIGRKLLTGITGVALMGFTVTHLAGNLTLLAGRDAFNTYAHKLESLGPLLIVAELGLLALAVLHVVSAVRVRQSQRAARSVEYSMVSSKGGPSQQGVASRSMLVTGIVLLLFLVLHVIHFKFGAGQAEGYTATIDGHPARDLYRLVVESFKQAPIVAAYVVVMVLLGVHLRHGFWSAFQSLGILNPKLRPIAQSAGILFACALAFGFLMLPIYLYLFGPAVGPGGLAMGAQP